jgi:transcriptional regulator with PAS, ATPase and Fis domain
MAREPQRPDDPAPVQPVLPEFAGDTGELPRPDNRLTPMARVWALAERVAPIDLTLLITGESGVGKERLARWVHTRSHRSGGPFVGVNCGAFADSLLETELFGHVRGAFTGAVTDRPGVFEAAHRGTLFLDEIGEVSPAMQVKLLRVLQEREVRRVGDTRARPVDVRVIAATNRDLPMEVRAHRFREDLYYRLHVVELRIPPLRQRPDELRSLLRDLLPKTAARLGRPITGYSDRAIDALSRYLWPGNIRELEHAIEQACAVATGAEIDLEDLPDDVRQHAEAVRAGTQPLLDQELAYIRAVLERHGGDRQQTANELGISLSTLKRRLRLASVVQRRPRRSAQGQG